MKRTYAESANILKSQRLWSRFRDHGSIKNQLMAVLLLLALVPLVFSGYFAYYTAVDVLSADVEEKLSRTVLNNLDKIDRTLFERYRDVQEWSTLELAKMAVQIGSGVGGASDFANYLISQHRIYQLIMLLDTNGVCVTVNTVNHDQDMLSNEHLFLGKDFSHNSWFTEAIQQSSNSAVVTDWHRVELLETLAEHAQIPQESVYSMVFASAIHDFDDSVLGVWVNVLNWQIFQEMLEQIQTQIPDTQTSVMSLLLLSNNDTIIAYSGMNSNSDTSLYAKSLTNDLQQAGLVEMLTMEQDVFNYSWNGIAKTIVALHEQGAEQYTGKNWRFLLISDDTSQHAQIIQLSSQLWFIGLVTTLSIFMLSYLIGNKIANPLILLSHTAVAVANGDLSQQVSMSSSVKQSKKPRHEFEVLLRSFTQMTQNLRHLIGQIKHASRKVGNSSGNISGELQRLSDVSIEQSEAIVQTTATVKNFLMTSREIDQSTSTVTELAEITQQDAHKGVKASKDTLQRIQQIKQANDANREHVMTLHSYSKEIDNIVDTITTIADNAELIAFNAALEAASAGEKGRRFGIVANEIRHLANTVATLLKDIEKQTSKIQQGIATLVNTFDAETHRIEQGVQNMHITATAFDAILEKIQQTTAALVQISSATKQQRVSNEQIALTLQKMSQETLQFQQIAHQTRDITTELQFLAEELQETVNVFHIEEQQ